MECHIDMQDIMSEDMTDTMPEDMPDRISNRIPNRMQEDLPDRMSDFFSMKSSDTEPAAKSEENNPMLRVTMLCSGERIHPSNVIFGMGPSPRFSPYVWITNYPLYVMDHEFQSRMLWITNPPNDEQPTFGLSQHLHEDLRFNST